MLCLVQLLAECVGGDIAEADGMQQLKHLLGSDDWQLSGTSAQRELANAIAAIPATDAASKLPGPIPGLPSDSLPENVAGIPVDNGGLMLGLTADITAAAERAAKDAISSSVQVGSPFSSIVMEGDFPSPSVCRWPCLRRAGRTLVCTWQVAGDAVKELPAWAGPDVIIAATLSKLDHIVAAANAQVTLHRSIHCMLRIFVVTVAGTKRIQSGHSA